MSTTTATTRVTSAVTSTRLPVWKHGLAAAVSAAVATTALAAAASSAGVSFADRSGESIPVAAFAELTVVFSLVGVLLAAVLARTTRRPQTTFIRAGIALTVLSFVPDLTFGFDVASAVTLIALHSIAATIVVPTLARRLPSVR